MCIFCKIVKGVIPCSKLYEDDNVLAFLDIMPVNTGHALIITKKHYETLLDVPDSVLGTYFTAVKKVAGAVKKGMEAEGFNMQMNNYPAAGQVVPHAHIHIVPRFPNDGLRNWPGGKYKEGQQEEVAKRISHFL